MPLDLTAKRAVIANVLGANIDRTAIERIWFENRVREVVDQIYINGETAAELKEVLENMVVNAEKFRATKT